MKEAKASIDPRLLELLVCPQVRTPGSLRYDTQTQELISDQAGLAYPIRDGIPIMLVSEARRLTAGQTADPSEI
ncbi:FIG002473: Protein YcaR in KDO2-Lipid A biosynthesis cluster [invertebrate metagenome]|uniref:FIG002473: Protein YcaR in KDO2-Lipid A biosynthesis cluster n=1 Tax=invertebrate metagenome TaxID=1711999 RepID=A0A484H4Q7_9ZZZZ